VRRGAVALVMVLAGWAAPAHAQSPAALGDVGAEFDADRFSSLRLRTGALFGVRSPRHYAGIAAQNSSYSHAAWHRDAPAVLGLWRDQSIDTGAGVDAQVGLVEVAGHTRAIGDLTWTLKPAADTGVELLAAAGLVETRAALDAAIAYSFWGAALEQRLAPRWTFVGLAAVQPFSDGNTRSHLRGRVIWDALPEEGINVQARWRQYHDSRPNAAAYFDPEQYGQWLAVAAFRRRVSGWTASGALGAGQEIIRQDATTTKASYLAELAAEGPVVASSRLVVSARYSRSAGFSNSPQYWWAALSASLVVPF